MRPGLFGAALGALSVVLFVATTASARTPDAAADAEVAAAVARGEPVIPWDGHGPVPPGYEATSRGNRLMIWVGFGTTVLGWLPLASYALGHSASCATFGARDCDDDMGLLAVPLAGPWLALGTDQLGGLSPAMAIAMGTAQVAGVALAILGVTQRQPLLRRVRGVMLVPVVSPGVQGVGVQAPF